MAKREMTGAAALQSYPGSRSANLHNGGGSFAIVDRAAPFQLSVEEHTHKKKTHTGCGGFRFAIAFLLVGFVTGN